MWWVEKQSRNLTPQESLDVCVSTVILMSTDSNDINIIINNNNQNNNYNNCSKTLKNLLKVT